MYDDKVFLHINNTKKQEKQKKVIIAFNIHYYYSGKS